MKRTLKIVLLAGAALALAGFSWLWFAPCGFGGCAPVSDLEKYQAEGSELLDTNGRPFGTLSMVNRRTVPLDSLPPYLPKAFLAVEDRRFYDHAGVDWKRVGGAMMANLRSGGVAEGGSTITMQLARNLFPEALPYRERSIRRKLMEIRVARQIERAFPKDKILELYLNHIYLGEGAYGVDAAARAYFGKPASQLTLAEAAMLGGLPKAPSQINPREDREAALARRDLVLGEMAKAGYVSAAEAAAARREPLHLARPASRRAQRGAWFLERVRRELEEKMGDQAYTAGLRVHTTFDPVAQAAAEEELFRQLDAVEAGRFGAYRHPTYRQSRGETGDGETPYLQGASIVLDARTGEVRALVGGRDYDDSKFDRVFQAVRQPGSAFKPFVYLAALQRSIPPTHRIEDAPVRITLAGGRSWEPRNYTGTYDGPLTLRDALARSKNTVTVKLAEEVGLGAVTETARQMGITTPIPATPAVALGAAEVRPAELAAAYAAFANGGMRVEPHVIRRVESRDGELLWEAEPPQDAALDPAAAFVLTSMLRDVVDRGTGTAVRAAGFTGPAAGKTGTTNAATDVWFAGYTPRTVGVVWMGLDRPQTIVPGASGGTLVAPVWGRMMRRITGGRSQGDWTPPGGVVTQMVSRATGQPVDGGCPVAGPTYTEYFVHTAPPGQVCYPSAPYPAMAAGDTTWRDEEWGAFPDTTGLMGTPLDTLPVPDLKSSGIDWPELESRRRTGAPPPPPAAGSGRRSGGRAPVSIPPLPAEGAEASEPRLAAGTPVAGTSPAVEKPAPRPEPKLLGRPVEGPSPAPSAPAGPAPAPPDTASRP
jgi:penicillin-binding protein 1A